MAVEELKRVYGTPPLKQDQQSMNRRRRKLKERKKPKVSDKQVQKVDLRV